MTLLPSAEEIRGCSISLTTTKNKLRADPNDFGQYDYTFCTESSRELYQKLNNDSEQAPQLFTGWVIPAAVFLAQSDDDYWDKEDGFNSLISINVLEITHIFWYRILKS